MENIPFGNTQREVRWDIRRELDDRGLTMADVARMAKVSRTIVSGTVHGYRHSPTVLDALRKSGIPERLLYDPRKVVTA